MGAIYNINKGYIDICCPNSNNKKEEENSPKNSIDKKEKSDQSPNPIFYDEDEVIDNNDNNNNFISIDSILKSNSPNDIFENEEKNEIKGFKLKQNRIKNNIIKKKKTDIKIINININNSTNNICPSFCNNIDINDFIFKVKKIQRKFRIYLKKNHSKKEKPLILFPPIKIFNSRNYQSNNNFKINNIEAKNEEEKDLAFFISEESFNSIKIKTCINNVNTINNSNINKNVIKDNEIKLVNTSIFQDNNKIKGNFLFKKCKFKYEGKKDKLNNNKKTGFGIIYWEDSSLLKGLFSSSIISGITFFKNFVSPGNFSYYKGEYFSNFPKGYGIYEKSGYSLEGMDWYKNYLTGYGIAKWNNGKEMYKGEFKKCIKDGIGRYTWGDGSVFMGEFVNNQISGYGEMFFSNGNYYEGQFDNGYLFGFGKFVWDDGKFFVGNYIKDKKHGFGVFVWKEKPLASIIGFWEKGVQKGLYLKVFNKKVKHFYAKDNENIFEIDTIGKDISKYLLPYQKKYKYFFKKGYNDYVKFVKFIGESF